MAKFLKHSKLLITILSIVIFSQGNVAAIDNTGTDGNVSKVKKVETVNPGTEKGNDVKKHPALKSDSLKAPEKISDQAKKGAASQTKVKKPDNSSPSIFSYNFVFYLMYKFKVADIFNISKEKNSISIPDESSLIAKGKHLANRMINKIID